MWRQKPAYWIVSWLLIPLGLLSQADPGFLRHLYNQGLSREHGAYLRSLERQVRQDSLSVLYAKYDLLQHQDSLFFLHAQQSHSLVAGDSSACFNAQVYFLKHVNDTPKATWFAMADTSVMTPQNRQLSRIYFATQHGRKVDPMQFPEQFRADVKAYNKINRKKPLAAAALSAVVPGLGKLYGSRPNSAVITFFSHAVYGVQTYESIKKLGIRNAFSIFSVAFFSGFYISNVYGSFRDLRLMKKYKRNQFLIDAADYYNFNTPHPLY